MKVDFEFEPLNVLEINDIMFVRKEQFDKCYDALSKVLNSQVLLDVQFVNYSEAISDAKELVTKLKEIRG